ncbi:MAG: cadherin-like beta sandwich domain-containing protein [Clostridium sp.]|uniref:N-acetylmuramoyl-L-alanine amidase family protein n=1 Tax=Clostridium sp. TaxID=1506 RepID=UPI0025C214C2|nr:cadherin-like beta sandwich domain-containing protein [Clostridium sp.]MCE5221769.1 cadherin-like beta sandwich domain-containing protein [Clostridium sp.]
MYKRIKYIIAASLVIGTISGILPANNFILGTTATYAATYKGASNGELSSLTITKSTGTEIELRDSYTGDKVSLTGQSDYYIELRGADGFDISADVKGSGYVVKQFTSAGKTEEGEDVGEYIDIDETYANIYLRTYKSEDAYKEAYDDGDVTDCEQTYVIHVKKPVVSSDEEDDKEYAYLRSIYLSDGNVDFTKDKYYYDVNVDEDVNEILVRATPEDDDDLVEINGKSVEEADNYEKTISLDKGNNTIKIYVEDDDDDETYTLNIYRGKSSTSTTQTSTSTTSGTQTFTIQSETNKFNAWQRVNGKWKYIDGTGEALKNKWWFDKNTGKNYYLKEDGTMSTGWFNDNSNWYYFNENGEMKTGWICLDKNWYYLSKSGVMQLGWLEDSSGNWYYLDNNGAMKTGWIENSDGKWYYLDSTGKMVKDTTINGSHLDSEGVLIN